MKKIISGKGLLSLVLAVAILCSAFSVLALAEGSEALAFCEAVSELEAKTELEEQAVALAAADVAFAAYLAAGGRKTDPAIADKYEIFVAIKSDMFVSYVVLASDAHSSGNYPQTRANLDLAGAILDSVELSELSDVATSFRGEYLSIVDELRAPEEISASFVARANAAKNATTFAEAKKNYDAAKSSEGSLTLEGYPGIEEAKQLLVEVQQYITECTVGATAFLAAVEGVYSASSFFAGIEAAYEEYEALTDVTVTGVPEAKATLDNMVSRHNSGADKANSMVKDMNSVIYGLILGDEKGTGDPFIDWVNKTFG